jgi:hypothetical protein
MKNQSTANKTANTKEIVVITNGFVFMGEVSEGDKYLRIDDAACIRVWGTTAGLGEIALRGVTPNTVLDPAGVVEVANHAVIMRIKCHA